MANDIREYIACCPVCGSYLQKAKICIGTQPCPECGESIRINIKSDKVTVFLDKYEAVGKTKIS